MLGNKETEQEDAEAKHPQDDFNDPHLRENLTFRRRGGSSTSARDFVVYILPFDSCHLAEAVLGFLGSNWARAPRSIAYRPVSSPVGLPMRTNHVVKTCGQQVDWLYCKVVL